VFFLTLLMELFERDGMGVGFETISKAMAISVLLGHFHPDTLGRDDVAFTRSSKTLDLHPGNNLACASAQNRPQPDTPLFVPGKAPHLI
jgi:hypothetical protein